MKKKSSDQRRKKGGSLIYLISIKIPPDCLIGMETVILKQTQNSKGSKVTK